MTKKANSHFILFQGNSKHQDDFVDALRDPLTRIILMLGGRRAGKTWVGAAGVPFFLYARKSNIKENLGWCVSPTYKQSEFAMKAFVDVVGWYKHGGHIVDYYKAEHAFLLLPAAAMVKKFGKEAPPFRLEFHSMMEPERMRGGATDFIWMDEGAYCPPETYGIVRPTLWGSGGPMWITTTPNGKNWLYEQVYRQAELDHTIRVIEGKSVDNPAIPRHEIERDGKTMSNQRRLQEMEAQFVSLEGSIYPMFNKDKHVIQPIYNTNTGQPLDPKGFDGSMIAGIDFGYNHPFVYLWILKKGNSFLVMDEYYQGGKPLTSHIEDIQKHVLESYVCRRWADRSAPQAMADLERLGVGTYPSNSDVKMGINAVAAAFEQGRLLISANCTNLIKELQAYHFKQGSDEPYKFMDDAADALRYALYSEATQEFVPNQINPWVPPDQFGRPKVEDPGKGAHAIRYDMDGNMIERDFHEYVDPWDEDYAGGVGPNKIPIKP